MPMSALKALRRVAVARLQVLRRENASAADLAAAPVLPQLRRDLVDTLADAVPAEVLEPAHSEERSDQGEFGGVCSDMPQVAPLQNAVCSALCAVVLCSTRHGEVHA